MAEPVSKPARRTQGSYVLLYVFVAAGPVDGLPSALPSTTLGVDWAALETTLRRQYWDGLSPDACTLSPNISFDLWRALTFLMRSDTKAKQLFRNAARTLKWQRKVGLLFALAAVLLCVDCVSQIPKDEVQTALQLHTCRGTRGGGS